MKRRKNGARYFLDVVDAAKEVVALMENDDNGAYLHSCCRELPYARKQQGAALDKLREAVKGST